MGSFTVELDPERAPITVENFLGYVDSGFYDETIFHRVIEYFMVQGGGINEYFETKETGDPIVNESDNGLKNSRGTVAMARFSEPDTAKAQFFVNVEDNDTLNSRRGKIGYAVFGRVVQGMEVVIEISRMETGSIDRFRDMPIDEVKITRAYRKK